MTSVREEETDFHSSGEETLPCVSPNEMSIGSECVSLGSGIRERTAESFLSALAQNSGLDDSRSSQSHVRLMCTIISSCLARLFIQTMGHFEGQMLADAS